MEAIKTDWRQAELSEADTAMLTYVEKLTRTPWAMEEADVDPLRDTGFSDRGIHDICAVTALFAYYNRIVDGLGISREDEMPHAPPHHHQGRNRESGDGGA